MRKYSLFLAMVLIINVALTTCQRTHFHESGQQGPDSYRFGFDTGPGSLNRHFRYEERDSDGYVRGKYGWYDEYGKAHVIEYEAHPKEGYSAKGPFGKYPN